MKATNSAFRMPLYLCVAATLILEPRLCAGIDYSLQLEVEFANGVLALDSGTTCAQLGGVRFSDAFVESVLTSCQAISVCYTFPEMVSDYQAQGGVGPNGVSLPDFRRDYTISFETAARRDRAYDALAGNNSVISSSRPAPGELFYYWNRDPLYGRQWYMIPYEIPH